MFQGAALVDSKGSEEDDRHSHKTNPEVVHGYKLWLILQQISDFREMSNANLWMKKISTDRDGKFSRDLTTPNRFFLPQLAYTGSSCS
jgi:hypothetical protein